MAQSALANSQQPASLPGAKQSILHFFLAQVANRPSGVAARTKRNGSFQPTTWGEMGVVARELSLGLISLGVSAGDRVCILASTRLEWVEADLAILGAGAVTVPIYQSNPAADCAYIIKNSGAVAIFVDSKEQLAKLTPLRADLPSLKHIIVIGDEELPNTLSSKAMRQAGRSYAERFPQAYDERVATLTPKSLLTIIYTSGTTGSPKGVMLSHGNMTFQVEALGAMNLMNDGSDQLLFLPMAHVFAKCVECFWLGTGHIMSFAESLEKLVDNMAEVKPTAMCAVPRVFEKVYAKVVANATAPGGIKAMMFRLALAIEGQVIEREMAGERVTGSLALVWALARKLVFSKIGERLSQMFGGRMEAFISGGAPLAPKIGFFFKHAGFNVLEGYGMTETAAPATLNPLHANHVGTVGPAVAGAEVRIAEDGEVLVRGPLVMMGYYNMPEATSEMIDQDGWLHTGDVGVIDREGYLKITDRKKDLLITSGGKNVAPQNLENALKVVPLISQIVVLGDRRKYLCALITLNHDAAVQLAKEQNLGTNKLDELAKHPAIRERLQAGIDQFNQTIASYERVKKFAVLDHDFTQESGELTPTMKVKRKVVAERYAKLVDSLYDDEF